MNALDLFAYGDHEVHTVVLDGEPWFVAGDIARVLDFRDAYNLVRGLIALCLAWVLVLIASVWWSR